MSKSPACYNRFKIRAYNARCLIVESVEDMMTLNLKCNLLENPLQVSGNKILLTFVKGEYKFNDFCICMASTLDGIENRRYDILYQRYSGNGRVYVTLPENIKGRIYK